MNAQKIKYWILAFRPKTLTAALVPVLVTSAYCGLLALQNTGGEFNKMISLLALLSAFCIQIGTNLINDAVDFKKGADQERIGPMRVTQAGHFTEKQVWIAGSLFFLAALLLGIPLVLHGGWPIVTLGLVSIFFGYIYTAGPYPLAYMGLGDLFVILFFGFAAVLGLEYLLSSELSLGGLILSLQIGFLSTVLIAINNLRDVKGDAKVGKKTVAVRFGMSFARKEIAFLLLAPYVLNYFWLFEKRWTYVFVLPFLSLPLAIKVLKNVRQTEPSEIYNKFLGQSAGVHLLFGLLISAGFVIQRYIL